MVRSKTFRTVVMLLCMLCLFGFITVAHAEIELHPGMITINGGQSIGDGSYINHNDGGYPFVGQVELTEQTIPVESCRLGVYSWDCDEDASGYWHTNEYDMVYVNGTCVGVLTGVNNSWKTSYFDVPIDLLKIGMNTITIYVGHRDPATGEIVQNTDDWLLEVKWLSLQIDSGKSDDAPEHFSVSLSSASRTESGIECSALVQIDSDKQRSYVVEYSLVDQTGSSPTNGQIIAGDEDYVSGTSIQSTGHFLLQSNAPMGNYQIQATLRDPSTNEVLAYTSKSFDLGSALEGGCEHQAVGERTFVKTEYSRLSREDADYSTMHQAIDQYKVQCAKCGEFFSVYDHLRKEPHNLPVCACGFVAEGHNSIYSATFSPVQNGCAGESFAVTVVTDTFVTRLEATNNADFPMKDDWDRRDNGDGTVTWTRIYTANLASEKQYWNVTAYRNSMKVGQMQTNSLEIKEAGTVAPSDLWDTITNKGDYTLKVMDADTGKPVVGASVVLMGQGGTTDANGNVVFKRSDLAKFGILSGSGNLYITAKDYYEHSDSKYSLGVGNSVDVIQLYPSNTAKVVPVTCNEDNIATGTAQLNVQANLEAEITVNGLVGKNDEIVDYILLQNGSELARGTNGTIKVQNAKFTKGATLDVKMQYKTANGQIKFAETPLNIVVVSEGVGNWMNLDSIPILQKLDLNINGLPEALGKFALKFTNRKGSSRAGSIESTWGFEEVKIDNYKITCGFGVEVDQSFTKLNEGLKKYKMKYQWVKNSGIEYHPSLVVECAFNQNGIYQTTGAIGISAQGYYGKEHTIPNVLWGIPLHLEWKLSGGIGVYGKDIGYNWNNMAWVTPAAEIDFTGEIYGKAGPGCKFANAGVYGKVTLNADGTMSISMPIQFSASGQLSGEIGLEAELELGILYWKGTLKLIELKSDPFRLGKQFTSPTYLANEKKSYYAMLLRNTPRLASSLTVSDVNYANQKDTVVPISQQQPYQVLEENIDALSEVQIAKVNDHLVMAYVVNDSENETRYGHIVYRTWDGNTWSEPQPLTDATLPQGDFDLKSDGEHLYIAYVQMKRQVDLNSESFANIDDLSDLTGIAEHVLAPCEIYVAEFDIAENAFRNQSSLTDDEAWDSAPSLAIINGMPAVAWVKDASNTPLGLSNNNALYLASMQADGQWQINETASQLPMVAQLELGELESQLCIAAVCDSDNDQETLEDRRLTLYGRDGNVWEVAQGQVSEPLFGQCAHVNSLIWYQDGVIMHTSGQAAPAQVLLDETYLVPAAFQLMSNGDRSYLLYTLYNSAEGTRSVIGIDINDANAYPVPMTNLSGYVDGFGAAALSDGLTFALIRTDALFTADSFSTVSELCVTNYKYQQYLELLALDWSTLDFLPGNTATILAYVRNLGSESVDQVQVTLSGAVERETVQATEIGPGETKEISFPCEIPENLSGSINVVLSLPDVEQSSTAAASIPLEFVDFYVDARQVVLAGRHYLLYSVQNLGSVSGQCTMNVRETDAEGEILFSKTIALDKLTVENDMLDLNEQIGQIDELESKVLFVELVDLQDDTIDGNNTVYVTFYGVR